MTNSMRRALAAVLCAFALAVPLQAGEIKDLEKTPQARTYQALLAAVAAGDYEAYKKTMTKASAEGIEKQTREMALDPKKAMGLLKEMSPADLHYVALEVKEKKATMLVTGRVFGEPNNGTIDFELESGQWKVAQQSWSNKKE